MQRWSGAGRSSSQVFFFTKQEISQRVVACRSNSGRQGHSPAKPLSQWRRRCTQANPTMQEPALVYAETDIARRSPKVARGCVLDVLAWRWTLLCSDALEHPTPVAQSRRYKVSIDPQSWCRVQLGWSTTGSTSADTWELNGEGQNVPLNHATCRPLRSNIPSDLWTRIKYDTCDERFSWTPCDCLLPSRSPTKVLHIAISRTKSKEGDH